MINETPKFAVVLSGCGVYDGSEIHEAVSLLLAIDDAGCEYQCFAPNTWQARTIDHFTGESTAVAGDADNRNVLAESARIARGNIQDLSEFNPRDFDAIIFPGGFGAAMNFCDFGVKGPECDVNVEVERALKESFNAKIVIGAMCIAPVVLARVLGKKGITVTVGSDKNIAAGIVGKKGITVTVGSDKNIAAGIAKMGAKHKNCAADEVCVDKKNLIVTVPAYMLAKSIKEVGRGARNLVDEILELVA